MNTLEWIKGLHEGANSDAEWADTGNGCGIYIPVKNKKDERIGSWLITDTDGCEAPATLTQPVLVTLQSIKGHGYVTFDAANMAMAATIISMLNCMDLDSNYPKE
jgi:hypothetical protein